jgi:hypothetical protein
MLEHRRRRAPKRSSGLPLRPKGWGATGSSRRYSSLPMPWHRLVVAPRPERRGAPNKPNRICGSEYYTSTRRRRLELDACRSQQCLSKLIKQDTLDPRQSPPGSAGEAVRV